MAFLPLIRSLLFGTTFVPDSTLTTEVFKREREMMIGPHAQVGTPTELRTEKQPGIQVVSDLE